MPTNRFPDSPEKRELRRRGGRLLLEWKERNSRSLDYCGMPSVEFLDIEQWRPYLRSVVAVEYLPEIAADMKIEKDKRNFVFPVEIIEDNILRFLSNSTSAFDVYNLDFYGGFLNSPQLGKWNSIDGIRSIFSIQAKKGQSFVVITTFNVRESGAREYLAFLDSAREELKGRQNSKHNLDTHAANQATRLKLCFPFFCWQLAQANGFEQRCNNIYTYRTTATLVHFLQEFILHQRGLPGVPAIRALIDIANMPLFEMRGQIPYKRFSMPQIPVL